MLMYNLIEYRYNCSKVSGGLWQFYRNETAAVKVNSKSFKSKIKMTGKTPGDRNSKNVKVVVPLEY